MSANTIIVHKNRTNVITMSLGVDVSADTITSEIRTASGTLIAEWVVTMDSDGTDGKIVLTLDDAVTAAINYPIGVMDIKRVIGTEPVPVFDRPLEVEFRETVTQ